MKKLVGTLAVAAFALPVFSGSASAFSVSARGYSTQAFRLILKDDAILNKIPIGESITSVEQISRHPYQFEVKAGHCTLTVELSTETPRFFIGNGLPHDPKVVDAVGCNS